MDFVLFPDLYEEWKDLTFTKELFKHVVEELKDSKENNSERWINISKQISSDKTL